MRSMNKMSAEDIAKLKAVALYVLDKCGETDFIHFLRLSILWKGISMQNMVNI